MKIQFQKQEVRVCAVSSVAYTLNIRWGHL